MKGCCERFKKAICCDASAKFPTPYQFNFNGFDKTPENEELFQSNYVRTSKYTVISFFPKALVLQFKRLANVYFLIIAILQTIPQISPLSPATAWAPFVVVLAISLLREGYEDFQRIKSDHETNYGTMTHVMRNGKFEEVNWSQVVVGDMVRAEAEEMFPADLILITSEAKGAAFIETASLDGQKNLKPRNAFKDLIPYNTEQQLGKLKGVARASVPDKDLKKYSAKFKFDKASLDKEIQVDGNQQFLYRGTRLKNTKWIYGLAVQTGKNTKIMMNSASEAEKMSQVQVKVNYILIGILVIQIILSIVVAIGYSIFRRQNESSFNYINWPTEYNVALDSVLIFFAQFVLINTMIPISLIVSIQIVKFFQMIFIQKDKLMYSDYRKRGVTVKSASLNEELGQIEYIFTDKTGTVTMNIMEFKSAVIGDVVYGVKQYAMNDVNIKVKDDGNKLFADDGLKKLLETGAGDAPANPPLVIHDAEGKNQIKLNTRRQIATEYIKALAIAHDVMADKNKKGEPIFIGQSPDEITLVEGAKQMGYQFIKATESQSYVNIYGKSAQFRRLEMFQFDSDRKRMSVVIRDNGKLKMYMKGADSIVEKRAAADSKLNIKQFLTNYSNKGLRTLLIAMRTISEEEYQTYKTEKSKLSGLPAEQRKKGINQLQDKLERNMYIIGATAVLDRLQAEVPETIRDLIRANIKVWMLTGDKMETAYNIANSCRLFTPEFEILRYTPQKDITGEQILGKLRELVQKTSSLTEAGTPKGLLIEGPDLKAIISSEEASIELANLAKDCEAVVCCRLEPVQKAEVVRVVRKHLNKITLAIGDGSNDVPMIKQAHIGIGLYGEEGMGAVQASDYALPEFRMLWRLLLVHGRWNYIRISEMILYFFYKNMLFTLPQFYIAFYCGFSAQTVFDDWYVALFNLAFTSIPLIIRAVFEQDVNYIHKLKSRITDYENVPTIKTLVKQEEHLPDKFKTNKYLYRLFPKIYFIGQENCIFNMWNYVAWMMEALIESLIIFFFTLYIISQVSVNSTGINSDYWLVSLTIYSTVIVVVTFKLATHTKFWSAILVAAILITTIGFYILHMWLTNFALTDYVYGTTRVAWSSLETYFVVLLCVCIVLFVDGIIVFLDFNRGGYTSRMREVIKEEKMNQRQYYDAYSLTITDNVTTASQKVLRNPREGMDSMVAQ